MSVEQIEEATEEQMKALDKFAVKYGRTWRASLHALWQNGGDDREVDGHCLRQIRNRLQFSTPGGFIERYKPRPLSA